MDEDMNNHEVSGASERMQDALEFWHDRWTLDRLYVSCVVCHAQQRVDYARRPFLHVEGCGLASDFAKHPWMELRALLADLPPVPV